MPCKNEIDWETRRVFLSKEVESRFNINDSEFDTLHKCLLDINTTNGLLSVSQLYVALRPYQPKLKVVNPNQSSLF